MRRAWIGAIAALAVATTATSQDTGDAWPSAMNEGAAAYEANDLERAAVAFEQAVDHSQGFIEEAGALRALAIVRLEQGRMRETLTLTQRALDVVAEHVAARDEGAIEFSLDILALRVEAFRQLGQDEDAFAASMAMGPLLSLLPRPGWRGDDGGGVTHVLSGFSCPATLEGLLRTDFTTYNANGLDVGCSYGFADDAPGTATIYFTRRDGQPIEVAADSMRNEIELVYGSPPVVEDDELTGAGGRLLRRIIF